MYMGYSLACAASYFLPSLPPSVNGSGYFSPAGPTAADPPSSVADNRTCSVGPTILVSCLLVLCPLVGNIHASVYDSIIWSERFTTQVYEVAGVELLRITYTIPAEVLRYPVLDCRDKDQAEGEPWLAND
jgi:hypothetical protein